jgi:hypothetical protein
VIAAAVPGTDLDHGGGAGEAIVGRRIKVFWPKDRAWYEGTIQAYKDSKHRGELAVVAAVCCTGTYPAGGVPADMNAPQQLCLVLAGVCWQYAGPWDACYHVTTSHKLQN